jgi:hypothetical protein
MKNLLCLVVMLIGLSANNCEAGIAITISGDANVVQISWNGSGTVADSGRVGSDLDFLNFGNIFNSDLLLTPDIGSPGLVLTNTTQMTNFTATSIFLDEGGSGDDLAFNFSFTSDSFGNDFEDADDDGDFDTNDADQYEVSGSATFSGVSIDDFVLGSNFTGSTTSGDANNLGLDTLTLNITGVPEPSSITLFALAVGSLVGPRRRRS